MPNVDLKARYLEKIKKRKRHHGASHSGRDEQSTFMPAASGSVAEGHTGMPPRLQTNSEADASRKNKKKDSGQKPASAEQENARTGDGGSVKKKKRKLGPADSRQITCRQRDTESCTDLRGKDRISEKMMQKVDWRNLFSAKKGFADQFGQGGRDSAGRGEPGSLEAQTPALCTKREKQKLKKHTAGTGAFAAAGNESSVGKADSAVAEPGNHYVAEGGDGSFPYDADPSDHAETPDEAYADVAPLLERLAECLGKTKETVRIYDPYYCNGGVIRRLKRHGFLHIYNRREDFYEKIAKKTTPDFDILLTNPPYSGDHPAKILDFCCSAGKPWLLLVPNWVYIKEYYPWCPVSAAAPQGYTGPDGQGATKRHALASEPVYLVPTQRYTYWTPPWLHASKYGVSTSPFPSFWFIQCGQHRAAITKWYQGLPAKHKAHFTLSPDTRSLPNEVRASFDPYKKRKNPRARKAERLKKAKSHAGTLEKRNLLRESREGLAARTSAKKKKKL